jgi:hypothetical protein
LFSAASWNSSGAFWMDTSSSVLSLFSVCRLLSSSLMLAFFSLFSGVRGE